MELIFKLEPSTCRTLVDVVANFVQFTEQTRTAALPHLEQAGKKVLFDAGAAMPNIRQYCYSETYSRCQHTLVFPIFILQKDGNKETNPINVYGPRFFAQNIIARPVCFYLFEYKKNISIYLFIVLESVQYFKHTFN